MGSKSITSAIVTLATVAMLPSGCKPHAEGVQESRLVRHFFLEMSARDQENEFTKYALDDQYDLYIWGCQVIHPPVLYLGRLLAQQGPTVVPFLVKKLESAEEEVTVRDIVYVFHELADMKLYDFSTDPNLMDLLDRKAAAMKGQWKDVTLRNIRMIRESRTGRKGEGHGVRA